jgi:protein phosphatase
MKDFNQDASGMSIFRISSVGKSDLGLQRSKNEDAFAVRPELGLCVLADGMGGAAAGEVASQILVQAALEVFSGAGGTTSEAKAHQMVQAAFRLANERILKHARTNPLHQGMGCTAEMMVFHNEGYVLGHVGDSRAYIFRKGQLKQLTRDHSIVQDQVDKGVITASEAKKHPLRNVILRAVGIDENLALDLIRGTFLPSDFFLLCSDGLTDMIEEHSIQDILSHPISLGEKVDRLVESANSAGGLDNITVILTEIFPL